MACQQKRREVIDELLIRHGFAGLGIARRQHAGHQIIAFSTSGPALIEQPLHNCAAFNGGRIHLAFARTPIVFWVQHQGGGNRPHDGINIGAARALYGVALALINASQHGAGDDSERGLGHVFVDGGDMASATPTPARNLLLRRFYNCWHVAKNVAGAKQRAG